MQIARNQETTDGIRMLSDKLAELGWYHSIELPDGKIIPGLQTIDQLKERIARYPIPQDLRGKRVLDIGAWDGWFSFEMERRGASVVAVDSTRQDTFLQAKKLLNSKAEYIVDDICYLSPKDIGYFDIVLFFGVLYHVKHPLLALERVCELTTEMACIESLVTDDPAQPNAIPLMEFYETTELAGQFDNWVGPNTSCLMAFLRTAGFVRGEMLGVMDYRAHAVAYRKWPDVPRSGEAPNLVCIENTWTHDHEFLSDRDHYFTAWFTTPETELHPDNVFVEAGGYAVRPAGVRHFAGEGWQMNCKLPLGLRRGWHDVRVSTKNSPWSSPARIPVDLPRGDRLAQSGTLGDGFEIAGVADGKTFEANRVRVGVESCISVWASGVPSGTMIRDMTVRLDGADLPAVYISLPDQRGLKQINAMLPPGMPAGEYQITVTLRGQESRPVPVELFQTGASRWRRP